MIIPRTKGEMYNPLCDITFKNSDHKAYLRVSYTNLSTSTVYFLIVQIKELYTSPNTVRVIKSRRMRWAGHVARMGEERGAYRVLVGKPEGKRPLGRPRRRCVDNIRMDLQEVGCGYVDWIGVAQDRDRWRTLMSAVMNLRVSHKCREFLD